MSPGALALLLDHLLLLKLTTLLCFSKHPLWWSKTFLLALKKYCYSKTNVVTTEWLQMSLEDPTLVYPDRFSMTSEKSTNVAVIIYYLFLTLFHRIDLSFIKRHSSFHTISGADDSFPMNAMWRENQL